MLWLLCPAYSYLKQAKHLKTEKKLTVIIILNIKIIASVFLLMQANNDTVDVV